MERQRTNGERVRLVEVHVLHEAVGKKEVVARPPRRQRRQARRVKLQRHLLARAENGEPVLGLRQQRAHVADAGVVSDVLRERTGRADLLVNIIEVAGRVPLHLARVAQKAKRGFGQWNLRQPHGKAVGGVVHQNLIPINLQVGHQADAARARRQAARQVGHHRARQPGREAHVVHHPHPVPLAVERFDIRRHRLHARLVRRVHRVGAEILSEAVQQQPQGPGGVPLTQV